MISIEEATKFVEDRVKEKGSGDKVYLSRREIELLKSIPGVHEFSIVQLEQIDLQKSVLTVFGYDIVESI